MKKVSFIHCADLHLDMPFKHLGSAERVVARRRDLLEVFDSIVNMAESTHADLLLVSGDLYEHEYTLRKTMLHVRDGFNRIKDTVVVLLPGNHDPFTANSFYNVIEWPENVHILCAETPSVHIERAGTSIYGAGWENSVEEGLERIVKAGIDPKNINILMLHGTIDIFIGNKGFNPVTSGRLAALGMDYIATGHFHNSFGQYGPARNIFNPGSPEMLAFDQAEEDRGVFAVQISKDIGSPPIIDSRFIKTGRRRHISVPVYVDGLKTIEDILGAVRAEKEKAGGIDDLYRIFLRGYRSAEVKIDTAKLEEKLSQSAFFIRMVDETTEEFDYEALRKTPGIKGMFTAKMLERIKSAGQDREKRMLEKALQYGLQALDEGKVDLVG